MRSATKRPMNQARIRIAAAARTLGTAARNWSSIRVRGRETASIRSASSAAIRVGTITITKARVPPSCDRRMPRVLSFPAL